MTEDQEYATTLQQQRHARAVAIAADDSWLTLAGLYWLHEGENSFGTATTNALVLPLGTAPAHAGSFTLAAGAITVHAATDVPMQVNGELVTGQVLRDDLTGTPDRVTLRALTMIVLNRGDRFAIRLYDNGKAHRQAVADLTWFAIDPSYRFQARFVPYEPAKLVTYGNMLGDLVEEESPGYVEFVHNDALCRLDALPRGDKFFFNFRDSTNGDTTYGAGRFLYTDGPQDGQVIVDFNQATNPYCAYTDYAICPLPPAQNRLSVRIEAGEQRFVAQLSCD